MQRFQIILLAVFVGLAGFVLVLKSCSDTALNNQDQSQSGAINADNGLAGSNGVSSDGSGSGNTKAKTVAEIIRGENPDACDQLQDEEQKNRCRDTIYYNTAIKNKSDAACEKISRPTLKEQCISRLTATVSQSASSSKDCNNITDTELKQACLLKVQITNAENINSLDYCNKATDLKVKQQCYDAYYIGQARQGKITDKAVCEKIQYENLKVECIALVKTEATLEAGKTQAETLRKQGNIAEAAKVECSTTRIGADVNYCIRDEITKEASDKKDATLCAKIPTPTDAQFCTQAVEKIIDKEIFSKAFSTKNIALCDTMKNAQSKTECKKILGGK